MVSLQRRAHKQAVFIGCFVMQEGKRKKGQFLTNVVVYLFTVLLVFIAVATAAAGQHFEATVTKIVDGDTIEVFHKGRSIRVRLWGIDTPEWRQPFSKVAKKYTAKLIENTEVELEEKDWDDYGRLVAIVTTKQKLCLNAELLRAGLAWVHIYYCKEAICDTWYQIERDAREKQSGLWRDKSPTPPWVWKRKKHS
ncbi:MAG: thermonuclease family protein [Proteobacteria bacterium]|nr:thermonuclease family protein [Pseudomonadota bacterium]MBU1416971.1 thermonuclease family protein [Pseudomonadota bacterium]MBU1454682.1 thermonuclease family protein [Pseudomonadota bacterium]